MNDTIDDIARVTYEIADGFPQKKCLCNINDIHKGKNHNVLPEPCQRVGLDFEELRNARIGRCKEIDEFIESVKKKITKTMENWIRNFVPGCEFPSLKEFERNLTIKRAEKREIMRFWKIEEEELK
jgi:hypothetical protein